MTSVNAQNTRSLWESEQNTRSLWESEPATSVNAQNTRSLWEKESLRESQPSKLAVGSQIVSHILRMWRLMISMHYVFVMLNATVNQMTKQHFEDDFLLVRPVVGFIWGVMTFLSFRYFFEFYWYRSGTVNSKSLVGKVLLRIKWKFKLIYAL